MTPSSTTDDLGKRINSFLLSPIVANRVENSSGDNFYYFLTKSMELNIIIIEMQDSHSTVKRKEK